MINYITKQTYTGKYWDILGSEGYDESCYFVTFKQAIKYLEGVSGSTMKGLTKAATLYRYKKETNEESSEETNNQQNGSLEKLILEKIN